MSKSEDYKKLLKLFDEGYKLQGYTVNVGSAPSVHMDLLSGKKAFVFESNEADVEGLVKSIQKAVNTNGGKVFAVYKDNNRFFADIEYLADFKNTKLNEVAQRLQRNEVSIDYVPADLVKEFLRSDKKYSQKFLNLKQHYYEIRYLSIVHSKEFYDTYEEGQKRRQKELLDILGELFKVFTTGNPYKDYTQFMSYCDFDTAYIVSNLNQPMEQIKHRREMMEKEGGMKINVGLRYLLDEYQEVGEPINRFLNPVRAAVEISNGNESPELKKNVVENWEIIKSDPKYGKLVENYSPWIRHAKAHGNIKIDDKGNITVSSDNKGRVREVATYDIGEFRELWQRSFGILTSFATMIYMQELALLGILFVSPEYKLMVAGIDNLKRFV